MYYVIKEYERENLSVVVSVHYFKHKAVINAARLMRLSNVTHYTVSERQFISMWKAGKLSDPSHIISGNWEIGD